MIQNCVIEYALQNLRIFNACLLLQGRSQDCARGAVPLPLPPDFEDIEKNTEGKMDNLLLVPPPQIFEIGYSPFFAYANFK